MAATRQISLVIRAGESSECAGATDFVPLWHTLIQLEMGLPAVLQKRRGGVVQILV